MPSDQEYTDLRNLVLQRAQDLERLQERVAVLERRPQISVDAFGRVLGLLEQ